MTIKVFPTQAFNIEVEIKYYFGFKKFVVAVSSLKTKQSKNHFHLTRDIVPSWEVKHHVQGTDFLIKKKDEENSSFLVTAFRIELFHQNKVISQKCSEHNILAFQKEITCICRLLYQCY